MKLSSHPFFLMASLNFSPALYSLKAFRDVFRFRRFSSIVSALSWFNSPCFIKSANFSISSIVFVFLNSKAVSFIFSSEDFFISPINCASSSLSSLSSFDSVSFGFDELSSFCFSYISCALFENSLSSNNFFRYSRLFLKSSNVSNKSF